MARKLNSEPLSMNIRGYCHCGRLSWYCGDKKCFLCKQHCDEKYAEEHYVVQEYFYNSNT
jgi:hypothetical protein